MKLLEIRLSAQKSLQWILILVATYNISKNKFVNGDCVHVIVKNVKFETKSYGLQFY